MIFYVPCALFQIYLPWKFIPDVPLPADQVVQRISVNRLSCMEDYNDRLQSENPIHETKLEPVKIYFVRSYFIEP